jgi:hypothetical protein
MLYLFAAGSQTMGLQSQLIDRFGFYPILASLIILIWTGVGSFVGSMSARLIWTKIVAYHKRKSYGGWTMRVSGGKSGRTWHAPIDIDLIRSLKTQWFAAFKRDLGTMLSGEGIVNFSLGVNQDQALRAAPPRATGLRIDEQAKVIEMIFPPSSDSRGGRHGNSEIAAARGDGARMPTG